VKCAVFLSIGKVQAGGWEAVRQEAGSGSGRQAGGNGAGMVRRRPGGRLSKTFSVPGAAAGSVCFLPEAMARHVLQVQAPEVGRGRR